MAERFVNRFYLGLQVWREPYAQQFCKRQSGCTQYLQQHVVRPGEVDGKIISSKQEEFEEMITDKKLLLRMHLEGT